ncbi:efflux transporter outer membrane subunit [Pedobacter antarcticus]|uniref:efflux transporter outer membrane subunit n=1 Tax=Pedobacter antarcticus TaxID=34086 RepID=UPI001C5A28B3|nr:efflux transporter outer membrane subunit [Pedobacter antarcticus]
MKIFNYLVFILLLFSACRTAKEFKRPEPELPASYRAADTTNTGDPAIEFLSYKSFFTDEVLVRLIDSVLKRNYDLDIALKNIDLNQAYLEQARAEFFPVITGSVNASRNNFSDQSLNGKSGFNLEQTIGAGQIDDYNLNLGLSWEADIWGRLRNQKAEAIAIWFQSKEAKRVLETRLIASTASAYFTLVKLREQLKIANKSLLLAGNMVKMINLQLENGAATSLALQQAEVLYKSTEAIIPDLEQDLFIQENALNLLMGRAPAPITVGTGNQESSILTRFPVGIPASLLANRPDVREKEYELRALNAKIGMAKANMYPRLSITAATGLNSFQSANWISFPASVFSNMAGGLTQPVFNRRRLKTELKVTQITYEQKVNEFKKVVFQAVAEVSDGLKRNEKIKTKINIAKSQNQLLESAIVNAELLFVNGMANYLEVIAVQQNLLENQLTLADLKKQQASAYVELYRAIGGAKTGM